MRNNSSTARHASSAASFDARPEYGASPPIAPLDVSRARVLQSHEAAAFIGLSVAHFRRLYRSGQAPAGIRVGERKLGWRVGDLSAWLDERAGA